MKVLLDTNIVIHREAATVIHEDIGILFRWLDKLHYTKCIHPLSIAEFERYKDTNTLRSLKIKLDNYHVLKTIAPVAPAVQRILCKFDTTNNDKNDTLIINELYNNRVDVVISEDKGVFKKALLLDIADRVYSIDSFLEKVTTENPGLDEYKVLAAKQEFFGNVNLEEDFFDSFKEDYPGFEKWFNKKADEIAYTCRTQDGINAFLYLKIEGINENYSDIVPTFSRKKRLKIGTFKVMLNGYRLGERFLKIIFDNALKNKVEEIYVTIFDKRMEQIRLINLLENFGFKFYGFKQGSGGQERVFVRDFSRRGDRNAPKIAFPFISKSAPAFLVPIYPEYHTELFPDSILRTESPEDFIDNEPHRNAISKVYISRAYERNLKSGDILIFYRTGGYYESVVSTLGIVEQAIDNIPNEDEFIKLCRNRSVFTDDKLREQWNYNPRSRPFIVNFLYAYSFPHRINMKKLIELGVIAGIKDAPRGFLRIKPHDVENIFKECRVDESIVVD